MGIAFDSAVDGSYTTGTSLTWAHTCSGSNGLLIVGTFDTTAGASLVTGVTYASVSMMLAYSFQVTGGRWLNLWYLLGPTTGANNVVISASSSTIVGGCSESYNGVAQSGQPDAAAVSAENIASVTPIITTVAHNAWVVIWAQAVAAPATASTNVTARENDATTFGLIGDSNGLPASPGSIGLTVTTTANFIGGIVMSFAPALPPTASGTFFLLLT